MRSYPNGFGGVDYEPQVACGITHAATSGADLTVPSFQTGCVFVRQPDWHGTSKSTLLSGELVILYISSDF